MAEITPSELAWVQETGRHRTVKSKTGILCPGSTDEHILVEPITGHWNPARTYVCRHCNTALSEPVILSNGERRWQEEIKRKRAEEASR